MKQKISYTTAKPKEKAVLIGLIYKHHNEKQVNEYLDELALLADTAGAETLKRFTQRLPTPDRKTFIGGGKLNEVAEYVKANKADIVIFDDEISGSQQRNIEEVVGCRVMDRNSLILDIFAKRARTAQSRVQVELAQYEYMLPRLTRMWTHLEKQRGGIGMRGPGEAELETDRRVIKDKISKLKDKLKEVEKQTANQKKRREELIRVALVGYTNAGKSTLMNLIAKAEVFAENKLFATLDTTVRKVFFDNIPFLMSDTVGFIRKLPHGLVESFKSTLDEVREADILLHVVDISHPNFEDQIKVVNQTLVDIGAGDKPTIIVFNKIDAYTYTHHAEDDLSEKGKENFTLEELKNSFVAHLGKDGGIKDAKMIFISATKKENITELRNLMVGMVKDLFIKRYPQNLEVEE